MPKRNGISSQLPTATDLRRRAPSVSATLWRTRFTTNLFHADTHEKRVCGFLFMVLLLVVCGCWTGMCGWPSAMALSFSFLVCYICWRIPIVLCVPSYHVPWRQPHSCGCWCPLRVVPIAGLLLASCVSCWGMLSPYLQPSTPWLHFLRWELLWHSLMQVYHRFFSFLV